MKNTLILIIVILVIGVITAVLTYPFGDSGSSVDLGPVDSKIFAERGQPAPDFVLLDYNDEQKTLSDFSGKHIVLNFWATWCPFCVDEMPDFQRVQDETKSRGVEFIGVNRGESANKAQEFSDDLNINYTLLVNRSDNVARAYNVRAMPTTYFIDNTGVVVEMYLGPLDEEMLKQKIYDNFHIGDDPNTTIKEIEPMPAEEVPTEVGQSTRTISITEGKKHSVPLSDIKGGGPTKDGIPSIDDPKFVSISEANEIIDDNNLGIAVSFNGVDRFYPFQIIVWHEIVNDTIGGQPAFDHLLSSLRYRSGL